MKALPSKIFISITVFLILLKLGVALFSFEYDDKDRIIYNSGTFKLTNHFYMGGDDVEVVNSALYYTQTGNIMTNKPLHSFIKPILRAEGPYITAFRPKAFVYTHVALISLYNKLSDKKLLQPDSKNIDNYLNFYGGLLYLITAISFIFSVVYFYKLLLVLNINMLISQLGTFAYILIPSIFIFIGSFDTWENIVLCWQVILFYFLLNDWLNAGTQKSKSYYFAPLLVLSALFRPHLLLTYLAIFFYLFSLYAFKKWFKKDKTIGISKIHTALIGFLILLLAHIPIFIQNYQYFDKVLLSTQSEFEFFQGHNPFARSSWNSHIYIQNAPYFDSVIRSKNITSLNEYEEGKFYSSIAKDWIKENPIQEFFLDLKKVAGYFLPYNHLNNRVNLYTMILELSFFVFALTFINKLFRLKNKDKLIVDFAILIPVLMTILLTILFFVGYRWRYYAEPFFLIMALLLINNFMESKSMKNTTKSSSSSG